MVATIAAWVGQHFVRKMIQYMGRASLIIFILAFTIFVSAISLGTLTIWSKLLIFISPPMIVLLWSNIHHIYAGGVGISNMVAKIQNHEFMGFEDLCKYDI